MVLQKAKALFGANENNAKETKESARLDKNYQCKVIWYQWEQDVTTGSTAFNSFQPASILNGARAYDISNHLVSANFSKSLGQPSGAFTLSLGNDADWAALIKPGDWFLVFMTGDGDLPLPEEPVNQTKLSQDFLNGIFNSVGNRLISLGGVVQNEKIPYLPEAPAQLDSFLPRLRCIGLAQRVATNSYMGPNGEEEITFTVSGKDMGVCLEESEIWFHHQLVEAAALKNRAHSLQSNSGRNLKDLMSAWFDAFLRPQEVYGTTAKLPFQGIENMKQWVLPNVLIDHLNLNMQGEGAYFGEIGGIKDFYDTYFENNIPDPFSGLQGNAWAKLKEYSEPTFHEFFFETDDTGHPRVTFRPIPWGRDQSNYPNIAQFAQTYAEFSRVGKAGTQALIKELNPTALTNKALSLAPKSLAPLIGGGQPSAVVDPRVDLTAVEVYAYDVGTNFHDKYNLYLVESTLASSNLSSIVGGLAKRRGDVANPIDPFPFRNLNSIKRHGLKILNNQISSFRSEKSDSFIPTGPFSSSLSLDFGLEANEFLRDLWTGADNYLSGTLEIGGKNEIKIGKTLVTDETFSGIANTVFYVEGYEDVFSVDGETGLCVWEQNVTVTHGIEIADLEGGEGSLQRRSFRKRVGSFHKVPAKRGSTGGGFKSKISSVLGGLFS